MRILGIETSCDETSAAVIETNKDRNTVALLTNVVASSLTLHSQTGGIIPEVAAREQIRYIIPVIEQALRGSTRGVDAQNPASLIDAIAVTYGPGLIGSLLVGVETAKTLAYAWKKPIIPVNHLIGHIYANFINPQLNAIEFPALALIVSGGHTDLVLLKKHTSIQWLGGTRDDAAGEAFDKIGRLLGLPYPGGPAIEKAAQNGNPKKYNFPRPMIHSGDFDFSFSGLKTAVLREIKTMKQPARPAGELSNKTIADISVSVQKAIIDVLVTKTLKAAQKYKVKSILLSGGVAANQTLKQSFISQLSTPRLAEKRVNFQLYVPPAHLCTDNAAMIASAAFFNYKEVPWQKITANPELYFE